MGFEKELEMKLAMVVAVDCHGAHKHFAPGATGGCNDAGW